MSCRFRSKEKALTFPRLLFLFPLFPPFPGNRGEIIRCLVFQRASEDHHISTIKLKRNFLRERETHGEYILNFWNWGKVLKLAQNVNLMLIGNYAEEYRRIFHVKLFSPFAREFNVCICILKLQVIHVGSCLYF